MNEKDLGIASLVRNPVQPTIRIPKPPAEVINFADKPYNPQPGEVSIKKIHIAASNDPQAWRDYLGALHEVDKTSLEDAKDLAGETAVRTAIGLGGQGHTIEVNMTVKLKQEGPFQTKSGGVLLERPGLHEIILVKPALPASLEEIQEEVNSPPQSVTTFNPPYPPQWNVVEGEVRYTSNSSITQSAQPARPVDKPTNPTPPSAQTWSNSNHTLQPTLPSHLPGGNSVKGSLAPYSNQPANPFIRPLSDMELKNAA